MAIIAIGYFSCKKESAAPVPAKSTIKKELAVGKKDTTTITTKLIVARDTTTK